MISFSTLGKTGARLGNQMFQYAFVRSQAKRLGVNFYVPEWGGDTIFSLRDKEVKCQIFSPLHMFVEGSHTHGFNEDAVRIQDNTEISGYFQSPAYFSKEDVSSWFLFNEAMFVDVQEKYKYINFDTACALHVRLGDYLHPSLMFYAPTPTYFKNALKILKPSGTVLVFSEDISLAKKYLGEIGDNVVFIDGNKDYEDLYLMSLCKDIVCSPSTFSWWAAYLSKHKDKRIIIPKSWFLPMCRVTNNDIFVDGWIRLKAHRTFQDNYYVRYIWFTIKKLLKK